MKRLVLYILPFILTALASCQDDLSLRMDNYQGSNGDPMSISIVLDDAQLRTRAIDMTPGTAVYLDKIWVGIYDVEKGIRIGGSDFDNEPSLGHRLVSSDIEIVDAVPFLWYKDTDGKYIYNNIGVTDWTDRPLCIVGVANYDNPEEGLSIYTNKKIQQTLFQALKEADTWAKFINIAVDTNSDGFTSGKPVLMGYLYKKEVDRDKEEQYNYVKVDQFASSTGVNLFPNSEQDREERYVVPKVENDGKTITGIEDQGYLIKLRRLRSRINVEIIEGKGIAITSMKYQVFNRPNSVYLSQRRTNVFNNYAEEEISFEDAKKVKYSPNSADRPDNDENNGYNSDNGSEDFWTVPTNIKSFAFDHFENKHWTIRVKPDNSMEDDAGELGYGMDSYNMYHEREKRNPDGTFYALTDGSSELAWNNNASFFKLKMTLTDSIEGRNAEVEYIIHEGFCNDKDGLEINHKKDIPADKKIFERLKDFSCVRNTNYIYNIQVNSVDDIYVNVTKNGQTHPYDQYGDMWELVYVKENENDPNQVVTGWDGEPKEVVFKNETDYISFAKAYPTDIAFRLIGEYNGTPVDLCYNFARGELDNFASLWPVPSATNTEYFTDNQSSSAYDSWKDYATREDVKDAMTKILLKTRAVNSGSVYITIKDYIDAIMSLPKDQPIGNYYDITAFKFEGYVFKKNLGADLPNYLRGVYIFDREAALTNRERIKRDVHSDDSYFGTDAFNSEFEGLNQCRLYQIYAAVQYPRSIKDEKYDIVWANKADRNDDDAFDQIRCEGGKFLSFNNGKGMILSDNPDMAFRLLGYDGDNKYDFCYNFSPADYPGFNNLWASAKTNNPTLIGENNLASAEIPDSFLDGMKVYIDGNSSVNIKDFIAGVKNGTYGPSNKLGFDIGEYDKKVSGDPLPYMRALYIFDKNTIGKPVVMDDNDIVHYSLYAAEQLPSWEKIRIEFDERNIIYDGAYFNVLNNGGFANNRWFTGRDASTSFYWHHVDGIKGYMVHVVDTKTETGYKEEEVRIDHLNMSQYLDETTGIITCPFPVTRYSYGTHNVVIIPEFDAEIVSNEYMELTLTNALEIQENTRTDNFIDKDNKNITVWHFNEDPWKDILMSQFDSSPNHSIKYNGLIVNHTSGGRMPGEVTEGSKYFQLGSSGADSNNGNRPNGDHNFIVHVSEPGTIYINVSNTGGSAAPDRFIYVYDENKDKVTLLNSGGLNATSSPATYKFPVDTPRGKPNRYYVYCNDNCRYYYIAFKRTR